MKHRYSFLIAIILLLFCGVKASAAYNNYSFDNYSLKTDTPRLKVKQVVPMGVDTSKYKPVMPVYRDVVGDSSVIPKSRMKQERAFLQGTYLYPPKPRSMWEVGLNGGEYLISANVRSQGGYGIGASLQKSIGYVVSLKTLYFHGITYGLNWEPSEGLANNSVLNGATYKNINYAESKLGEFYYNYKNVTNELVEQAMFSINNIGFHKKALDRKFNLFIGIGGGAMEYKTWYNALGSNGQMYNYSGILQSTNIKDRKTIIKELKSLMDGTYETLAQGETDESGLFGGTFRPVIAGSIGVSYHLSKRFEIGVYENATFTYDRLLDGNEWQEHPHNDPALAGPYDNTHYIYATVGYFFGVGKSVEPLYWQNPMEYTYDALNTLIKKNVDDLIDTDDDGVVDRLDREPNSAPGAIVDTHGVTKDSDGDGIPDYLDKEPFSQPGVKVDSTGVTLPQYRPVLRNQIDSVIRHDIATGALSGVPGGGGGIGGGVGGNYCNMTNFPTVNFDLDKYNIKPEFFAHLYEVAMAMMACPDKKMVAIGNTDDRETSEYNDVLSWERVNKCIDYLVTTYSISRDRFIVKAEGKAKPLVPGLPDHGLNPVYESRQYLNRRVEFHWAQNGETGPSSLPKPKGPQKAGKEW